MLALQIAPAGLASGSGIALPSESKKLNILAAHVVWPVVSVVRNRH
jgi:hypothetical protein